MIHAVVFFVLLGAPQDGSSLQKMEKEIQTVLDKVRPSVALITTVFKLESGQTVEELTFSGVVYSKEGHVVTDASGVEQASEIHVRAGGNVARAKHVASDKRTGVAVLRVDLPNLVPASFADEPARPGATAIAVGNALGARWSAAVGTVTARGLSVLVKNRRFDDLLQVTSPVQPGDCGGFVADATGRFIGLVHSGAAPEQERGAPGSLLPLFGKEDRDLRGAARGSGFVTASEWVRFSADRIIKHGRMVRGWIGLSARPLESGVEVIRVDFEGPARRAGIAVKDVLLEFDGEAVKDVDSLRWKVAREETARKVKVVVARERERLSVDLHLEIDPQK
ncbi:MAG TPA: S1C family serine protease [Planctomycetota bacterium]